MNNTPTFIKLPDSKKLSPGFFFLMIMIFSVNIMSAQEIYYVPVELSGFNKDVIAENIPAGEFSSTSVDNENDNYGGNFAFPTEDLVDSNEPNGGLPINGMIVSEVNNQIVFQLNDYDKNNSLKLSDNEGSSLIFVVPVITNKIYVLATSGESPSNGIQVTINFSDGPPQYSSIDVPDWGQNGSGIAKNNLARIRRNGTDEIEYNNNFKLYQREINIHPENQNKEIVSVTFRQNDWTDGLLNIFALTAEFTCTEPITITADKEFLCNEDESIELTAVGGELGIIYFQGNDMDGEYTTLGGDTQTVTGPGTYYFRAYNEDDDCWGVPYSIHIEVLDFDFDAGEDQMIGCGESVQIGFEPTLLTPDNYCIPEGVVPTRLIENFTTSNGIVNISNINSGFSPNGYGDFTNMILKANPGDEISFSASVQGGATGFRIWIDWDRDDNFDGSDNIVWHSQNYFDNHNGSFIIPTVASGIYRMRIASHWLSETGYVNPCEINFSYGEFEDYTVQIGSAINETTTLSWSPPDGLDDPTIPNPIASPDVTTTYTLSITHEGCEFTDTVTVSVEKCLPPLDICVGDVVNLNQGLPENVNPNDVIWYDDDNNSPGNQLTNFQGLSSGIYWAFYDDEYWKMEVTLDFTEECLECFEVMDERSNQSNQVYSNITPADYGVLDFYEVSNVLRVILNNTNIINSNWFNFNTDINIQFLDGAQWGSGDMDPIATLTGSEDKPIIRIVFGISGIEGFYGSRVSATDPDYQLEPLELINGVSFVNVVWHSLTPNNKIQIAHTTGNISFYFRSLNIIPCPPKEVFINPQIRHRVQH